MIPAIDLDKPKIPIFQRRKKMVTHKIKGGFLKKFFPTLDPEKAIEVQFPGDMKELNQLVRDGKLTINGVDFPIDAETVCGDAWRGFSLQHQGAAGLSEEEKAERALDRKAERDTLKELKENAEIKAAIERKKAELRAAKANG
jgi:hypothetical protein